MALTRYLELSYLTRRCCGTHAAPLPSYYPSPGGAAAPMAANMLPATLRRTRPAAGDAGSPIFRAAASLGRMKAEHTHNHMS